MERDSPSRIRGINMKSMKVTGFVDQKSHYFVGISLLEGFKADSGKISDEMRELLQEILGFISNSFRHNEISMAYLVIQHLNDA